MERPSIKKRHIGSIIAIVALLTYIAILLVITRTAQDQLQQRALGQVRLSLEKQAAALSYFFQERRQDLIALRKNPTLQNYFINRDLGMSMQYGLRASLIQMTNLIEDVRSSKRIGDLPVYMRLAIFDESGRLLANSGELPEAPQLGLTDLPHGDEIQVRVMQKGDDFNLMLVGAVPYKNGQAGTLVAWLDHRSAFTSLTASTDAGPSTRFIVGYDSTPLRLDHGRVDPLDEQTKSDLAVLLANGSTTPSTARISEETFGVHTEVPSTPFWLVGLYSLGESLGILPSRGFFIALVFVALSVLAGAAVLLRVNTNNLVLRVRLEEWKRQESMLSAKNRKLELEIGRRIESERQLHQQANFDQLTGLPNRALAIDRLSQAITRADREDSCVLVVFADLDRFKQINDSLGHAAGDQLLIQVANRLGRDLRANDTVARFGGDEFVLIFPDARDSEVVQTIADRILKKFLAPFCLDAHEFQVTTSLGLALYPQDGADPMALLKNADTALYEAKDAGRNTFCFFTPSMNNEMKERILIEAKLRQAIARHELSVRYQPLVCFDTGEVIAFEALLRWNNPELGEVSPGKFIPLAEESGLIEELGAWVLDRACRDAQEWQQLKAVRLAVNLSSRQLRAGERFFATLERTLRDSGLDPSRLELEVTETVLLEDLPDVTRLMQDMDRLGVRLALDDFGTGYSALSYLKHLPFDVLKIDRTFVQDCTTNPEDAELVRAILAMARALHMEVVGEGVETAAQAEFLRANRCDFGQGYHFCRPITREEVTERLSRTRRRTVTPHLVGVPSLAHALSQ